MKIRIERGRAEGRLSAPPSKSMAHRMLICAGLSEKPCVVHGISDSEDMLATLDCLRALGVVCEKDGDTVTVRRGIGGCRADGAGTSCVAESVHSFACCGAETDEQESNKDEEQARNCGTDAGSDSGGCVQRGTACGGAAASPVTLPCRESGSTLRFFVPIALLTGKEVVFTGSERLMQRPLEVYDKLCRERSIAFEQSGQRLKVCGRLTAGKYELAGDVSSQFVTGLLFVLPLLDGESRIVLRPPVESRSYIDMTIEALRAFGVAVEWETENCLRIDGGQRYTADEVFVEGDYSNAAFFEALNVLGADVRVENLREDSLQGDRVYRKLFAELSAAAAADCGSTACESGIAEAAAQSEDEDNCAESEQKGKCGAACAASTSTSAARSGACGTAAKAAAAVGAIDISDCPDLGPVLMAVAAALCGGRFTGTKRLKIKESNRGEAMAAELRKFGVSVTVGENDIIVGSEGLHEPSEALDGHNDHRIVMSEAVLLTQTGGIIKGSEAVAKSFPDFFERLASLGIEVKKIED